MESQEIWALIGLIGGAGVGFFGWWFGRRLSRKNRGIDELYNHVWKTARSTSWIITLVFIYLLFTLYLFGVNFSVASVLGMLIFIHLGSWAIIGTALSVKYSINK